MHFPRQMHFPHWMHFPGQMHFRQQMYFPRQQCFPSLLGVQRAPRGAGVGPQSLVPGKPPGSQGKPELDRDAQGQQLMVSPPWQGRGLLADSGWDRGWEQFSSGN